VKLLIEGLHPVSFTVKSRNGSTPTPHRRTIISKYGTSDIQWLRKWIDPTATGKPKLKYLLPLDDEIAHRIKSLSKPYPNAPQAKRRCVWSPSRAGGLNPTVALYVIIFSLNTVLSKTSTASLTAE